MKFNSITTKIAILFTALMFLICAGLGLCAFLNSKDALKSNIDENLLELARADSKIISEKMNTQLNALESLAINPSIIGDDWTIREKMAFLKNEAERSGHKNIILADTNGITHSTDGRGSVINDQDYFKKALEGESTVSDPIISKADGSVIVCFAVPIKDGDNVIGVLVATRDGNELSTYTNNMQTDTQEVYMISSGGTMIANKDQNLVLNMYNISEEYKENPELEQLNNIQKKMVAGESGVGEYTFDGVSKYMGYYPVEGTTWSLAVTAPKSVVMSRVTELTTNMLMIAVIFLLIGIVVTIIIARNISKPIKETTKYLNVMAAGDFTGNISKKMFAKRDEIGILAKALDKMQSSMRSMMKSVVEESNIVRDMLTTINRDMQNLNEGIEEISATTEELSAGTEETAASSEQMNATSAEVEKTIESFAAKAQEGAATVSKVSAMSEDMKIKAISSKQEALEIYGKTKDNLQDAIEQAKAVEQINELSEAILGIAGQTNLLSLNASIEAARAGESGKGFAVVANEIGRLAESSMTSVNRIQEVTNQVISVVNALSSSSMEVMEFIEKKVLDDYEGLVETSEKYNELSLIINNIVMEFSSTSEELLSSIHNMVEAITQISVTANEEASGASNIAERTEEIVNMAEEVVKLANKSNEKSESLIEIVNQFKI